MKILKRLFLILIVVILFNPDAFANEKKEQAVEKADLEKQISYALGYDIVDKLKANFELDLKFFIMGASDRHSNQLKLTEDKLKELLVAFQQQARQRQIEQIKKDSEANRAKGIKFLEENMQKDGVVTLASGLQYKALLQGQGPFPKASDTVECHYKGTLIDGTVFDSSYQRGTPATFQVGGVIKGWIEALQMMKVGSKWQLFVPPDLAYGDRGAGRFIQPGSTLIFEVELLSIVE
ncbi:FKBP-type peptidyl-prolyl cis-trans isomerase [Desulfobacula phenolica]|uniref:Peptidyl-prolyl cis-trans isomerase n=1 Tax=Desulfobacula phenolica TaxID=90732 RepID=A0A1H2DTR1_9BACT|nr:FKBP-type peptidyl-prolyl cis-trans isomerase [Desulfobacula phenolica]SDT86206.1 FKBP-type peptidyl-prolyl cis-trans isomerase FklB [Desulfobacula phenolica]